jgi:hypothetical protein
LLDDVRRVGVWLFDLKLDLHSATVAAVVMLAVFLLVRQVHHRVARFAAAAALEIGIVCGLFALWQVANDLTRGHTTGGLRRGQQLWDLERWLHLPSETSVQHLILGHPLWVRATNYYYDTAHLTAMFCFLIWLWLRHRDRYPEFRNTLALLTGMCLLIQMIAVAPPRLISGTGLVDTPAAYGQSVYPVIGNFADQYAAMPSIHVGWAMLISYAVVRSTTSRWRWVFAAYGPLTFFAVVATANHYWLDGFAAMLLLAFAIAGAAALEPVRLRLRLHVPEPEPEPAQIQQGAFS